MGNNERTTTSLSRMGHALEAQLKALNDCWSQEKKSFTLITCTNLHYVLATCACLTQTKREVCSSWSVHIFTAPPSQQLSLKRVLYLRWQQWSHSPGLIYLRDGIMNSLWHLIWPSLLIWVSAGI